MSLRDFRLTLAGILMGVVLSFLACELPGAAEAVVSIETPLITPFSTSVARNSLASVMTLARSVAAA